MNHPHQNNLFQSFTQRIARFCAAMMTALALMAILAGAAFAASPQLERLQTEWAEIKYKQPKDSHERRFKDLLSLAEQYAGANPSDPEILVWWGIIEGSYAGAKGGIGALGHVKNAKKNFERVIAMNPKTLDGSALTSLGSLYYQVPGWPIGFGDDQKAAEFLKKGLAVNPDGIDSNYFYGDFLFRDGQYAQAEAFLRKALLAPPRPGRELADSGRKSEIQSLLAAIVQKR
jgi:tetratricopeptide (TPR) repeat protein